MSNHKHTFGDMVFSFFRGYLREQRGCSPNTVASYGDSVRLLVEHARKASGARIDGISVEDIDEKVVLDFLNSLERERNNLPVTRNQRLAAIKSFFRFLATQEPELIAVCERICAIPAKSVESGPVDSMSEEQARAIVDAAKPVSLAGTRDRAILLLFHNTGARVQEIADLNVGDLRLKQAPMVQLTGKGGKRRVVPLWPETAEAIEPHLQFRRNEGIESDALILNQKNERIGRFGLAHIVKKHKTIAQEDCESLRNLNVTPHTFRHTTALALARAGVDIVTVKEWLGHADVKTTSMYVEINMRMKREALRKYPPPTLEKQPNLEWKKPDVIKFLRDLGKKKALC